MGDAKDEAVEGLIMNVMKVQRRYAHELRNVKTERQEKVREAVENAASESKS